ncbi:hypothetical protein ACFUMI_25460, partial [Streptomyces sp. NPDC057273]
REGSRQAREARQARCRKVSRNLPASAGRALQRQEGSQTAQVQAVFNGGTPTVVKSYTADVISQPQSLTVNVPSGASSVSFRFRYTGSNNWYWVIDGVKVTTS